MEIVYKDLKDFIGLIMVFKRNKKKVESSEKYLYSVIDASIS